MNFMRETYRGYMWPFLTFLGAIGYGMGSETHSWWHYAEWPSLAVAVVALQVTHGKIKRRQS